jgi:WsaF, C-terminal domain
MMHKVAWLIPRLVDGSGGIRTMLQHAQALEVAGHECHLYIEGKGYNIRAGKEVKRRFGYSFKNVSYGWGAISPADVVIATIWYSVPAVRDLRFACAKTYLVQDYEPLFNPVGYEYIMAENSYRYGLVPVTVGRWLRHLLLEKYNLPAFSTDFSADTEIYHPLNECSKERAVCFIYQPDKPRRCGRLGIDALGIVKHHAPDVKVYLYGSEPNGAHNIWFDCTHLGLLSRQDCNVLYNRCVVGLCLSASNPSRIPFEMMAAGLPVIELWRKNNLFDFSTGGVSLSKQTPESLASNILRLINDHALCSNMSSAAIEDATVRARLNESSQFVSVIEDIINGKSPPLGAVVQSYDLPAVIAETTASQLPDDLAWRISRPGNARLNSLPPFLRNFLGWGARKVRSYILD